MTRYVSSSAVLILLSLGLLGQPAFAQTAPGVTQSAAHAANISGTVTQSNGTPVAGADVRLMGPSILTTKSDDRGVFSFTSVPWGNYQISVTSDLGIASRNILVNGDLNVAIQYAPPSGMRTIAHVSTSSAGVSINVTPASIASITPSDYAFQGNASWQQLLNQIPGVTVGGGLRSGVSCGVAIAGGPFQPIVLSINGAAPYETSVTLDGMPLQNVSPDNDLFYPSGGGSGTNVSFLPLATFDTADIVRGPGANAPSIVDAIGGSFVLHAPGAVTGNHFEYSVGNDMYGGIISNAKVALQLGRLSLQMTYGINDSPGPYGTTHSIMTAASYWPFLLNGQPVEGGGFGGFGVQAPYTALAQALYCCMNEDTAWTSHSGSVALSYNVTPSLTAQVFYVGSSSEAQLPYFKQQLEFQPSAGYTGSIAPGTYYLPALIEPSNTNRGESMLEEKLTDYVGPGVLRLAALQNNSYYQIGFPYLLPPGNYKVYGTIQFPNPSNPSSPTTVNYNGSTENLVFYPCGPANKQFWTNNRDLSGSYTAQIGSNSTLEAGYVTSYYNTPYQEHFWTGGAGGIPEFLYNRFRPTSASSTTDEFHMTFSTQVSDKLALTGAWYFAQGIYHVPNPANYSAYVQPTSWLDSNYPYNSPRISAVWRANNNVAIRAAAGGGYALPPLLNLVGTNSVSLPCTTICSETVTNLNLRPEESFGYDVGSDVRFNHDTIVSADLYYTNLWGQFYETQTAAGTYNGFPLFKNSFGNLAQSRYEGVNISAQHQPGKGIYWSAALGLNRGFVVSVPPGFYNGVLPYSSVPCKNCVNAYIIPGINFNGAGNDGCGSLSPVPYANGTATVGYRWKPGTFIDLQPTYYGKNNSYFQPAFVEMDAHLGYAITRNVTLFATVRNVTNVYPDAQQTLLPTGNIPTISGADPIVNSIDYYFPVNFFGVPYGPRAVIVTANFKT